MKHKVELLEEELRKKFHFWLELCEKKIRKSVVYDGKLIIILEGLEYFREFEKNEELNAKFWLPRNFPCCVKVIVTSTKESESNAYLKRLGCQVLELKQE